MASSSLKLKRAVEDAVEDSENEFFSESESEYCPDSSSSEQDNEPTPSKKIAGKLKYMQITTLDSECGDKTLIPSDTSRFIGRKHKTSSHTLSMLNTPKISSKNLGKSPKKVDSIKHGVESIALHNKAALFYNKWILLLNQGFNILLHGVGSKVELIQKFVKECLSGSYVLVVNGFFPRVTVKEVLSNICEGYLQHEGSFPSMMSQCDYILRHSSQQQAPLYLVIHSIDGKSLRSEKSQSILCRLASNPNINLLASVDNVASSLLWDQEKLRLLNFLHYDCTNYTHYKEEVAYSEDVLGGESRAVQLSSLLHVYQSLTPNAQQIYTLIVKHHLESSSRAPGILFSYLYDLCRQAFLVTSDLALRTQLTEFKDHNLIKQKTSEGGEMLLIHLARDTLQDFLEMCSN